MTKLSKLFTTLILILFGLAAIALILVIQITKPTSQEVVNSGANEVKDKIDFSTIKEETADTSNWKDYIDTRLGFKTKLPPDWEVKPLPFRYEGNDDFVMFKKKSDPKEFVVAELGFSYQWNEPMKKTIEEKIQFSNKRSEESFRYAGYDPKDYIEIYYTYKKFKISKNVFPVTDPENRWDGDQNNGYTVYTEDGPTGVRSFAILIFSPQIPLEQTDLITHGILDHLERIEIIEERR